MIFNVDGFKFQRTLGMEKEFREETGQEFNAQLAMAIKPLLSDHLTNNISAIDEDELATLFDLNRVDVINELVAWMFLGDENTDRLNTTPSLREAAREHMAAGDFTAMDVLTEMMRRFLG